MSVTPETKPSGPVAAAFIAAGVGAFTIGLMVVVGELLGDDAGKYLDFSKNYGIGSGVGPLSGKVITAVIAYIVSWVILHFALRRKEIPLGRALTVTLVLVALGFALTFPPIFELFAA